MIASSNNPRQRVQIHEDTSKPLNIVSPNVHMHAAIEDRVELLLAERASKGRRTLIRVGFEVYGRATARPMSFHRLPSTHVLISCPGPSQAKAVIKLLQQVCEGLDGKFLAED